MMVPASVVAPLVCLLPLFNAAFALPAPDVQASPKSLVKRASGHTRDDPIPATFDVTKWPNIAEQDCYVMLCHFDGNRVYQRGIENGRLAHYKASGAKNAPFRNPTAKGVERISSGTTSAEEFPWASLAQGGVGAILQPAAWREQTMQGTYVSKGFRDAKVDYLEWIEITFEKKEGNFGPYCTALHQNPPDKSVCDRTVLQTLFDTPSVNLATTIYRGLQELGKWYYIHQLFRPSGPKVVEEERVPVTLVA